MRRGYKKMSSKIIIIAATVLLIASVSVLFAIEDMNHDYDYKKAWSVVYFENPRDNSLDFAIENHEGARSEYDYKIFVGSDKVIDEKVEIDAGVTQKISPVIDSAKLMESRILVEVSRKETDYKIYKDLGK
jgi:hypothetical protein